MSERTRAAGAESFAADSNVFALAMYEQLRRRPGNLVFSPLSIRLALGMAYGGARGETAAQMREVLRVSSSDETLHSGFSEILKELTASGDGVHALVAANSLWSQDGAPLRPEFVDLIARRYGGGVSVVDFRGDAEAARGTINRWVEDKTMLRIRDLISAGGLDFDTRLVLVNAVYFKGTWARQFKTAATRDELFTVDDGGAVQVPLMHQQTTFRYMQAEGYQAVDLAYLGGSLAMLVLLPDRKDGLRALEKALSVRMLHDLAHLPERDVDVFLPRFKITWGTVDLRDTVSALGLTLALDPVRADFSGINGSKPPDAEALFISAAFHQAFADVNEEGTEAAAATAIKMALSLPMERPPVPVFRADRPFLFAIRDRRSSAILFLGRITDPTREI